ncbi:NYN domain-containing protein, partial [Candidatus Saccharibacteria bacterium]|nr:NYN domain-containing protein [Candidatus Saccharibacteria bacterium]
MSNTKPNYAFIDSQNLNLGIQKAGWKLDWRKFREYLLKEHNVKMAYLFIGYMAENEAMYEQLHSAGYLIVLKPTVGMMISQTEEDASNKKTDQEEKKQLVKGNIDAELVLYAMKEMPNYKKAIIVSGDGDFYCLAEYLANKKRLAQIMTP